MSRSKKLIKDTFIYGIGNFGSRLLGFLLLPFYTTIFSKSEYGYIDLITMGSILFMTIVSLKLTDGAYRFLWDAKSDDERRGIISSVLNAILISFIIATLISVVIIRISHFELLYGGLIFVWLLIRIVGEYFQQSARSLGSNHVYSVSGIILAVCLLASNLLLIGVYKMGVFGFIISLIVSYTLSLIYSVLAGSFIKYYRINILSLNIIKTALLYSLPLLPAAVSWWLIRVSGRFFLTNAHGLEPVGIYAVADKLPTMIYMFNMTFYMAWQDAVIKHFSDKDRNEFLNKVMGLYVRVGLSLIVLLTLLLKPFFNLMINTSYHAANIYVPVLLIAVFILCLAGLYDAFFMGVKKTSGILFSAVAAAATTVLLNIIFIKQFGIWATTISTLIAAVLLLLIRIFQLKDEVIIIYRFRDIAVLLILWALASVSFDMSTGRYILMSLIVSASLIFLNLKEIKSLFSLAKEQFLKFI